MKKMIKKMRIMVENATIKNYWILMMASYDNYIAFFPTTRECFYAITEI